VLQRIRGVTIMRYMRYTLLTYRTNRIDNGPIA